MGGAFRILQCRNYRRSVTWDTIFMIEKDAATRMNSQIKHTHKRQKSDIGFSCIKNSTAMDSTNKLRITQPGLTKGIRWSQGVMGYSTIFV